MVELLEALDCLHTETGIDYNEVDVVLIVSISKITKEKTLII